MTALLLALLACVVAAHAADALPTSDAAGGGGCTPEHCRALLFNRPANYPAHRHMAQPGAAVYYCKASASRNAHAPAGGDERCHNRCLDVGANGCGSDADCGDMPHVADRRGFHTFGVCEKHRADALCGQCRLWRTETQQPYHEGDYRKWREQSDVTALARSQYQANERERQLERREHAAAHDEAAEARAHFHADRFERALESYVHVQRKMWLGHETRALRWDPELGERVQAFADECSHVDHAGSSRAHDTDGRIGMGVSFNRRVHEKEAIAWPAEHELRNFAPMLFHYLPECRPFGSRVFRAQPSARCGHVKKNSLKKQKKPKMQAMQTKKAKKTKKAAAAAAAAKHVKRRAKKQQHKAAAAARVHHHHEQHHEQHHHHHHHHHHHQHHHQHHQHLQHRAHHQLKSSSHRRQHHQRRHHSMWSPWQFQFDEQDHSDAGKIRYHAAHKHAAKHAAHATPPAHAAGCSLVNQCAYYTRAMLALGKFAAEKCWPRVALCTDEHAHVHQTSHYLAMVSKFVDRFACATSQHCSNHAVVCRFAGDKLLQREEKQVNFEIDVAVGNVSPRGVVLNRDIYTQLANRRRAWPKPYFGDREQCEAAWHHAGSEHECREQQLEELLRM